MCSVYRVPHPHCPVSVTGESGVLVPPRQDARRCCRGAAGTRQVFVGGRDLPVPRPVTACSSTFALMCNSNFCQSGFGGEWYEKYL